MIKTCVFPVAGLGSRFLPATKSIPKEMLVVVDKPLIQYAVEEAKSAGIERFVFVTSQGKAAIEDHFDRNVILEETLQKRGKSELLQSILDTTLEPGQAIFVRQQQPLGLGHAILCAKHLINEEAFAVVLADDLVLNESPCLKQMVNTYQHKDGNMAAVMNVALEDTSRYGILSPDSLHGKKIKAKAVIEKPKPENAPSTTAIIGRYILSTKIFDYLQNQPPGAGAEIQLTDALSRMLKELPLTGYSFDGERFDCGTREGWLEANVAFAQQDKYLSQILSTVLKRYLTS